MVHSSGQVGVGKSDAAEWRVSQDLARGGRTVSAKEESWLWA